MITALPLTYSRLAESNTTMLKIYAVLIVLIFNNNLIAQIASPKQVKVDSVLEEYFDILEKSLIIRDTLSYLSLDDNFLLKHFELENRTIELFENLTQIKVDSVVYMYASGPVLTQSMLNKWRNWIKKNKSLIIWDSENQRLDRIDRSLYKD